MMKLISILYPEFIKAIANYLIPDPENSSVSNSDNSSDNGSDNDEANKGASADTPSLLFTRRDYDEHLADVKARILSCTSTDQAMKESFAFVNNIIPENIWATTEEELKNDNSLINRYLDNLSYTVDLKDQLDYVSLCHIRAATSTVNALLLFNCTPDSHPKLAKIIFDDAFNKMVASSEIKRS